MLIDFTTHLVIDLHRLRLWDNQLNVLWACVLCFVHLSPSLTDKRFSFAQGSRRSNKVSPFSIHPHKCRHLDRSGPFASFMQRPWWSPLPACSSYLLRYAMGNFLLAVLTTPIKRRRAIFVILQLPRQRRNTNQRRQRVPYFAMGTQVLKDLVYHATCLHCLCYLVVVVGLRSPPSSSPPSNES
jgi:hypothetical protein